MPQAKVNVKALQPFAHGNLDAREGGVYAVNAAEVEDLEKAGFVTRSGVDGDVEQTQVELPQMNPQPGDVVADEDADILGSKMDQGLQNKAAARTTTKK
jgi:hypothetical protein